jgi:hypothetical protein
MPEMGPYGLLSGDGKRGGAQASVLASILDSTHAEQRKRTVKRIPVGPATLKGEDGGRVYAIRS